MITPSEQLAANIVEGLIKSQIVLPEDGKKIVQKLSEGKLRSEDWRLIVEKGLEKEKKVKP